MIENFTEKVITSADTRRQAIAALGFDEPPVEKKLCRSDFKTDEEYLHAVTELSLRNHSPEYRETYRRIRREYLAQQEAAQAAAAEQKHQEEIKTAIRNCVLSPDEQKVVDDEARRRAQADLAAGKISFQQMGASVEKYAEKLTAEAKEMTVHNADINRQIRAAMQQICGKTGKA